MRSGGEIPDEGRAGLCAQTEARAAAQAQAMVLQFHEAFDLVRRDTPGDVDPQTRQLRLGLILEELLEFAVAAGAGQPVADALRHAASVCSQAPQTENRANLVGVADALADLLYVVYGACVSYGVDIWPIFQEVHRSNMAKVGGHKREDGKWIKPPHWQPPRIAPLLREQGWRQPGG